MLDENNSLLTAVSEEEAATVCGGYSLTFDANGNPILNLTTDQGITGQKTGPAATDVKYAAYITNIIFDPTTGSLQGTASTVDKSETVTWIFSPLTTTS